MVMSSIVASNPPPNATVLRLLCAVQLPLVLSSLPKLLALYQDLGTVLYFTAEDALQSYSTILNDREVQSAALVNHRAPRNASVLELLQASHADVLADQLVLLGIDGNRPVTIARLVRECWTSDLRDRFLSCTLTMHDDNSLTDSIESLKAGRAYFLSQGFSVEEVLLAHVFIDSSM